MGILWLIIALILEIGNSWDPLTSRHTSPLSVAPRLLLEARSSKDKLDANGDGIIQKEECVCAEPQGEEDDDHLGEEDVDDHHGEENEDNHDGEEEEGDHHGEEEDDDHHEEENEDNHDEEEEADDHHGEDDDGDHHGEEDEGNHDGEEEADDDHGEEGEDDHHGEENEDDHDGEEEADDHHGEEEDGDHDGEENDADHDGEEEADDHHGEDEDDDDDHHGEGGEDDHGEDEHGHDERVGFKPPDYAQQRHWPLKFTKSRIEVHDHGGGGHDYSHLERFEGIGKTLAATVSAANGNLDPAFEKTLLENTLYQDLENLRGVWLAYVPDGYGMAFNKNYDMSKSVPRAGAKGCGLAGVCDTSDEQPMADLTQWFIPQLNRSATLHFPYVYVNDCCNPTSFGDYVDSLDFAWFWNYASGKTDFDFFTVPISNYLKGDKTFLQAGTWGVPFTDPGGGAMVSFMVPIVTTQRIEGSMVMKREGDHEEAGSGGHGQHRRLDEDDHGDEVDHAEGEEEDHGDEDEDDHHEEEEHHDDEDTRAMKSKEGFYVMGVAGVDVKVKVVLSCPEGMFSDFPICKNCAAGSYRNEEQPSDACQDCPPGFFGIQSGATACEYCPAGFVTSNPGQTRCVACSGGYYAADRGMSECMPCAVGEFMAPRKEGDPPARGCDRCPVGSFADSIASQACAACGTNHTNPDDYATFQSVVVDGHEKIVPIDAATSMDFCSCRSDTHDIEQDGNCKVCDRGLDCPGKSKVFVKRGYWVDTDIPTEVWECYGDDGGCGCIGGDAEGQQINRCEDGRLGFLCLECPEGFVAAGCGCVTCNGEAKSSVIGAAIVFVVWVVCIYVSVLNQKRRRNHGGGLLLVGMTAGQVLVLVQQLGVFQSTAIIWPEPFKSVINAFSLLAFNVDFFGVSCITPMSPLVKYHVQVLIVVVALTLLVPIHLIYVARFGARKSVLFGAQGMVLMVFYISVVVSIVIPFRCFEHPNGVQTLGSFPSVMCWQGGDHQTMLTTAGIALIIPAGFLSFCVWLINELPKRLQSGDADFLDHYGFMFSRFKVECHWYGLPFLIRNLLISLSTVLPGSAVQIVCLAMIALASLVLQLMVWPWRFQQLNVVECACNLILITVLVLVALLDTDVDGTATTIGIACTMAMCVGLCTPIYSWVTALDMQVSSRRKPIEYFLCYHQAGAGAFTRLLRLYLAEAPGVWGRPTKSRKGAQSCAAGNVFIRADEMQDLEGTFGVIQYYTRTFIAVCSKEILKNHCCMGEMICARIQIVNTYLAILPDFEWPDTSQLANYIQYNPDITRLASQGMNTQAAIETVTWLRAQVALTLEIVTPTSVRALAVALTDKYERNSVSATTIQEETKSEPGQYEIGIVVNHDHTEALCIGGVIQHAFRSSVASVVLMGESLPADVTKLILICSNGCFLSKQVALLLFAAMDRQLPVVSVIAEQDYRFPTDKFYQSLQKQGQALDTGRSGHDFSKAIHRCFVESTVAMLFSDVSLSQSLIDARCKMLVDRLLTLGAPVSPPEGPQKSGAVADCDGSAHGDLAASGASPKDVIDVAQDETDDELVMC